MKKNLFLFTGEETYLLLHQINDWKDAFIKKHGDINLEILDGAEKPLNEIMAAAIAMPFLADKRLIFIHNLPDAPKTRNPDEATQKDEKRDEDLRKFEKSLDDIPDSSVVVFIQPNPDKRRSFYKKLSAKAEVKEFPLLSGEPLVKWLKNEVKAKGASIDSDTAEYLISLTGQNLWRLAQESAKLASYNPEQPITKDAIDQIVVPTLEANIFHFTDALGTKDHKKAIQNLHRTMAAGENLRQVFYMIVRQFRLLIQASGYVANNPNGNSMAFAATFKLHPFVARNTLGQLKHFKQSELTDAYARLLDIDTGLKTSKIRVTTEDQDELALAIERFILKFCCN
jgi:DNA polymerase III subunit delta